MSKSSFICHCLVQVVYLEVCAIFPSSYVLNAWLWFQLSRQTSSCRWMSLEGPEGCCKVHWVLQGAIEFVTSKMESNTQYLSVPPNPILASEIIRNSQTKDHCIIKRWWSEARTAKFDWTLASASGLWLMWNCRNAPNQAASCCCPFPIIPQVRVCVFCKEIRVFGKCAAVQKLWSYKLPPTLPDT